MEAFEWNDKSEHYSEAHAASLVISVGWHHETDYKMELSFSGGTIYREVYGDDLEQAKISAMVEARRILEEMKDDLDAISIRMPAITFEYIGK